MRIKNQNVKRLISLLGIGILGLFFISSTTAQPTGLRIVTGETASLSQYGITWHFDREVEYGKYVNGDWWVVGPVMVTGVTPAPTYENGEYLNGSMVNPQIGEQGYDSRTYMWTQSARVEYPIALSPGDSLVSSISDTSPDRNSKMPLRTAAILTVISSTPTATAFRPSYIGTIRESYDYADVDLSILPALSITADFPSPTEIASDWERRFERPWLLHGSGWVYGRIFPSENQHWYHRNQFLDLSGAAVLLISDWSDKETLLIRYLQLALDYYSVHLQGGGGPYYWRWPIIFAGIMLGDAGMRDMFVDETYEYAPYHDSHIYFFDDPRLNRTEWSATIPMGDTWTLYEDRTGKAAVFYTGGGIGGGNRAHHEHLAPAEWYLIEQAGYPGGGSKQESYRRMHSAGMVGCSLAALAFDAENYLANNAYVPYTDRWMYEDDAILTESGYGADQAGYPIQSSGIGFVDSMWFRHRGNMGK